VLEVGVGTGLVLLRIAKFAKSAKGVDLSPKMLERARERGLDVSEASATDLPFPDASFDVTCSFKVLAHVPQIDKALGEMTRVTRPGGVVIAEFYNPWSFRGVAKRIGRPGRIAMDTHEGHVFTRYDSPLEVRRHKPRGTRFIGSRGIRIAVPFARAMKHPLGRFLFRKTEHALCDSPLRIFGGFWIAAFEKE
jgi:ubiquinone/menaquinone biosynthesis C-methylase UbiE